MVRAILPQTAARTISQSVYSAQPATVISEPAFNDDSHFAEENFVQERPSENGRHHLNALTAEEHSFEETIVEQNDHTVTTEEITLEEAIITGHSQAADPWDDPLPAWEYSRSEYPILLGPREGKKRNRLWIWVALVLLLAGAVIIATFFFLKPGGNSKPAQSASSTNQPPSAALIPHSSPAEKPATETAATTPPDSQANGEKKPEATTDAGETTQTEGEFSLQVAASADEADANRYAERLKLAGLPAYVTPADIAGRGRWYRVKVGRFKTADEAKNSIAEYRQRARTAGLNLDFIVSSN